MTSALNRLDSGITKLVLDANIEHSSEVVTMAKELCATASRQALHVTELVLTRCRLSDADMAAVAHGILHCSTITALDLRHNAVRVFTLSAGYSAPARKELFVAIPRGAGIRMH